MELLEQLAALESSDLIHSVRAQPELEYMFRHALVQDAAYASLLRHTRRALHQAVGETLEGLYPERLDELAPLLAQHYAEGGDDRRALHHFVRAAEIAARKYANAEAVASYSSALEAAMRLELPTTALHHARGQAYELVGAFEPARADYEAELDEACARADRHAEWQALMDLGFLWAARDYGQSGVFLQRAYDLAATLDEPLTLAHSLNRLGNWHVNLSRPLEALRYHEQALDIFQGLADRAGMAGTLDLLAMDNFTCGDIVQAYADGARAQALFRELGLRQELASSLAVRGFAGPLALLLGQVPGAPNLDVCARDTELAVSESHEIGWRSGEAFALVCLGTVRFAQGAYGPALSAIVAGLQLAEAAAHQQWMTGGHWGLGWLYHDCLAGAQARQHALRAYELARQTGSGLWIDNTTGLLASVYMAGGELAQAEQLLDRWHASQGAGTGAPETSAGVHSSVHLAGVELALSRGQPDAALRLSDELLATAPHIETFGSRSVPRLARLRGEALTGLGRFAEAEVELQAALAGARSFGARPTQWRIQRSLARLYAAQSRAGEREQSLAAARSLAGELAESLSAEPALRANFLSRAHALLR